MENLFKVLTTVVMGFFAGFVLLMAMVFLCVVYDNTTDAINEYKQNRLKRKQEKLRKKYERPQN